MMGFKWSSARFLMAPAFMLLFNVSVVDAQTPARSVELSGHVLVLRLSEFDITDVGVGATVVAPITSAIAIDGTMSWFWGSDSDDFNGLEKQRRLLGLAGVRSGVTRGSVDVFGRARAGFLNFAEQEDVICIAVFPPPLGCVIAAGHTAFAADFGGGVSIGLDQSRRLRLNLDLSDLLIRYPGETFGGTEVREGFVSHNFLFSLGLGWRF